MMTLTPNRRSKARTRDMSPLTYDIYRHRYSVNRHDYHRHNYPMPPLSYYIVNEFKEDKRLLLSKLSAEAKEMERIGGEQGGRDPKMVSSSLRS